MWKWKAVFFLSLANRHNCEPIHDLLPWTGTPLLSTRLDLLGFLVLSPASPRSDRTGGNTWVKENKSNHSPAETDDLPVVIIRPGSRHSGYLCLLWPEEIHFSTEEEAYDSTQGGELACLCLKPN